MDKVICDNAWNCKKEDSFCPHREEHEWKDGCENPFCHYSPSEVACIIPFEAIMKRIIQEEDAKNDV